MEKLLAVTIETAKSEEHVSKEHLERVNVDTTVQEKAVAFPTDARLYYKARRILVRLAKRDGIELRQRYERLGKSAFIMQGPVSSISGSQAKHSTNYPRRVAVFALQEITGLERGY
jgi:transposase, IS5 family